VIGYYTIVFFLRSTMIFHTFSFSQLWNQIIMIGTKLFSSLALIEVKVRVRDFTCLNSQLGLWFWTLQNLLESHTWLAPHVWSNKSWYDIHLTLWWLKHRSTCQRHNSLIETLIDVLFELLKNSGVNQSQGVVNYVHKSFWPKKHMPKTSSKYFRIQNHQIKINT